MSINRRIVGSCLPYAPITLDPQETLTPVEPEKVKSQKKNKILEFKTKRTLKLLKEHVCNARSFNK